MAVRLSLLPLLAILLSGWTCAQTINLQVSAIPSFATRVVAVVDQGGLATPLRFPKDVTAGNSAATLAIAVPAGGPYRVRAIAFTAGLAYPAILRAGKVMGVLVPNQTTVSAQIALAARNAALDAATPASAPAGSTVTLAANITDPGDTGIGASATRVYSATTPLAGNQLGDERSGPLERLAESVYRLSTTMATPASGATLYYQFAYNAWDFNDGNNVEQPYWFWPNLAAGESALTLASQVSSGISLTVSGLPAAGNRIVAVVDGAALQRPVRAVKDYAPGQSSTTMFVDVPAASGYRVRVVAFTAGSPFPAILRTGKVASVQAPVAAAVALADPVFALTASTPATAPAGSTVALEATLTDPGDVAAGMPVASVYSRTQVFTANLNGTESRGVLEGLGSGNYRLSVSVALPAGAATTYYQFAANAFDFNAPSGTESPYLCWPNPQAGQALKQVASTLTSSIRIAFSGTPATATRVIAIVDQGALTMPVRAAVSFTAGLSPADITVGVPPGGPYRVRLIAFRSGLSTPVILRAGRVTGVNVSAGVAAAVAVALTDYSVALDPATPTSGIAGAMVTVIANVTDLGETASGANASRLYGDSSVFTQNLSLAPIIGLLEKNPNGTMKLTTPVTLPGAGGVFYYQLAYEALDFRDADGVERPFFCWPNLEAGQALKQIGSNANPSLFTISGVVTLNGAPLSGVTVSLSGPRTSTVVTGADGAYSFSLLSAGSYTVSAGRPNYTFAPASSTLALSSNRTANFSASPVMAAINVTVSGVPATATRLIAVVDQGALPQPVRTAVSFAAGQAPANLTVDVPPGGPYRVRMIAFRSGLTAPVILRSGRAGGLTVAAGAAITAALMLTDYTVVLDPATPASGITGEIVTVAASITDPGETASGATASRLYGASTAFTQNLFPAPVTSLLEQIPGGAVKLTASATLPAAGSIFYYQMAYDAVDFSDAAGLERPLFCWPNLEAAQPLQQIVSNPKPIVYTISGRVTLSGAGLALVTMSLAGLRTASVVTSSDGSYSFAGLAPGGYTVTPARANFTFNPASSTLTLASNQTVNFSVSQFTGTIGVSRNVLRFGATLGGAAATATQGIEVDVSDNLPVSWTITSDKPWLTAAPASGLGSGNFVVSVNATAIASIGMWTGTLTLKTNTSTSAKLVIQVYLGVSPATTAPFGLFETPVLGTAALSSSVPVTGWALDDVGVKKVQIWRDPIRGEAVHPNGLVYIGDSIFVPDARPDVAAVYSDKPNNYRAGWGYLMLTNTLPNPAGGTPGNGTYRIHAIAVDEEGKSTELGVKTITVDNGHAVKPFGTIDSPAPGETIAGTNYGVTGWALTPQPAKVHESGQDIWLIVDGVVIGNVSYNGFRGDVAGIFPTYANANGSAGSCLLDTTRLANGMHSISWVVTDSAGHADGLGSRYFFVRNTVVAASEPARPVTLMAAMSASDAVLAGNVELEELGRVELQLPPGLPWRGRLAHGENRVPLPAGSTLDPTNGAFVWQLAPGFLGEYTLEFENGNDVRTVRVVVRPHGSTRKFPKE